MFDRALLPPSGPLLIAVSGGCDSMALWAMLAGESAWQLSIFHLDHAIRADSPADAALVATVALPGERFVERCDIPALAVTWGCGLEAAGRRHRYARLTAIARQVGSPVVVTAHHRDDQAETALLNLLRGSHGIVGMPSSRPLAEGIHLVRPLLAVPRAAVRAWAVARQVPWRDDSTNTDTTFRRNRVRHVLLPGLEAARPGITDHLIANLRPAAGGPSEDPVRTLARDLGLPTTRPALNRLRELPAGQRTTLGGWLFTRTADGALTWEPEHLPAAPPAVLISGPGTFTRGGCTLTIRVASAADCAALTSIVILTDLFWPVVWRAPLAAERWRPLGCPGRQLLMDSLAARKVPARHRPQANVLADGHGPVWLPAAAMIAERVKLGVHTESAWVCTMDG